MYNVMKLPGACALVRLLSLRGGVNTEQMNEYCLRIPRPVFSASSQPTKFNQQKSTKPGLTKACYVVQSCTLGSARHNCRLASADWADCTQVFTQIAGAPADTRTRGSSLS